MDSSDKKTTPDVEKIHSRARGSISSIDQKAALVTETGEIVNASGHRDQLKRHYGLLSICGLALTVDNAWVALGGSIAVSISMSIAWTDRLCRRRA